MIDVIVADFLKIRNQIFTEIPWVVRSERFIESTKIKYHFPKIVLEFRELRMTFSRSVQESSSKSESEVVQFITSGEKPMVCAIGHLVAAASHINTIEKPLYINVF